MDEFGYPVPMQLHDAMGPTPRLVRLFLLEKGITLPVVAWDAFTGAHRGGDYARRNPGAQFPALELDDGPLLAESRAICEYVEELHPEPALIGRTPRERAETRMWVSRIDARIVQPAALAFRSGEGLAMYQGTVAVFPESAAALKALARDGYAWLDGLLGGAAWICGPRFTLADLVLYATLDAYHGAGQPLAAAWRRLGDWYARLAARPSAEASLHPQARAMGARA
jgi:glutathione S-transferase